MPDERPTTVARRTPWNKGKLIGAKPPLRRSQVWSIRTRLLIERRTRDLALFNLAIDSKLRGCDIVALRVEDVAPGMQEVVNGLAGLIRQLELDPFSCVGRSRDRPHSQLHGSQIAPAPRS